MVSQAYMLHRPGAPSALKRFVDQRAFPVAINALGAVEARVERVAARSRRSPLAVLSLAAGCGAALALAVCSRRRWPHNPTIMSSL